MHTTPRVSVIIPVFNRDWCIADALQSVIDTAYPALEILVIDDGSEDGTPGVLDTFSQTHPTVVRILHHPDGENRGAAASRNLGLREASGKYIAFLDSDDIFYAERFCYSIPWLEQQDRPMAGIEPYCLLRSAQETPAIETHLTTNPQVDSTSMLERMLFQSCYWKMPTITIPRVLLEQPGQLFDERLSFAEETALWLKLAALDLVGVIQHHTPIAEVRRHGGTHSRDPGQVRLEFAIYHHVVLDTVHWLKQAGYLGNANFVYKIKILRRRMITFIQESLAHEEITTWDTLGMLRDLIRIFPSQVCRKWFVLMFPHLLLKLLRKLSPGPHPRQMI